MDNIVVDTSILEFMANAKKGIDYLKIAHEVGYKEAFAEKYEKDDPDFNKVGVKFEYCYFVSTIYAVDLSAYINSLMSKAMEDETVSAIVSMFSITLSKLKPIVLRIHDIAGRLANVDPYVDKENYVELQKAVIIEMVNADNAVLQLTKFIINQEIEINWASELLSSIMEFNKAYEDLMTSIDVTDTKGIKENE